MKKEKIQEAIKLPQSLIEEELKLEDYNFRVNSEGWTKKTQDNIEYFENQQRDIWEINGEQLFTWDSAMRETQKAGKIIPTNEEFNEILKAKEGIANLIFPGYRYTGGSFYNHGTYANLWSSSESGSNAWGRGLYSSYTTVFRSTDDKAYGFSVRCLQK